jgi:hypothetical protein
MSLTQSRTGRLHREAHNLPGISTIQGFKRGAIEVHPWRYQMPPRRRCQTSSLVWILPFTSVGAVNKVI